MQLPPVGIAPHWGGQAEPVHVAERSAWVKAAARGMAPCTASTLLATPEVGQVRTAPALGIP